MRWALVAIFLCAAPDMANAASTIMPATIMDVAPTTLILKPGMAGLFFVTNHGGQAVTVQIEAMDWRQDQGRDVLAPSAGFFASPPMVRVESGARQTVRVMARPDGAGEHVYRLLVSELPDPDAPAGGVHVLLQFSVPVFVQHDPGLPPQVAWSVQGGKLVASNLGPQTVKLSGLSLNGAPSADNALVYLLPGAARTLGPVGKGAHVQATDGLSGTALSADVAP